MSTKATKWAWQADLPPHLKLTLLALADFHNGKTGQCNPRVETIMERVGAASESTVHRQLRALEKAGYIAIAKRRRGKRQASSHYALALDGVVFQSPPKRCSSDLHPRKSQSCTGASLYIEEPEIEHIGSPNVIPFKVAK